jgi:hypothetical protein
MTLYAESIRNGHPDVAPGPALEAQYLMRAAVPAWADYMAQWDADGKAVLTGFDIKRDIPYGDTPEERLDIILPTDTVRNAPVQCLIHGAYWRALDKTASSSPPLPRRWPESLRSTSTTLCALPLVLQS